MGFHYFVQNFLVSNFYLLRKVKNCKPKFCRVILNPFSCRVYVYSLLDIRMVLFG